MMHWVRTMMHWERTMMHWVIVFVSISLAAGKGIHYCSLKEITCRNMVIREGEDLSLICMNSMQYQAWCDQDQWHWQNLGRLFEVTWLKDGTPLHIPSHECTLKHCNGYVLEMQGRSLTLANLTVAMAGRYTCNMRWLKATPEACANYTQLGRSLAQHAPVQLSYDLNFNVYVQAKAVEPEGVTLEPEGVTLWNEPYPWRKAVLYLVPDSNYKHRRIAGHKIYPNTLSVTWLEPGTRFSRTTSNSFNIPFKPNITTSWWEIGDKSRDDDSWKLQEHRVLRPGEDLLVPCMPDAVHINKIPEHKFPITKWTFIGRSPQLLKEFAETPNYLTDEVRWKQVVNTRMIERRWWAEIGNITRDFAQASLLCYTGLLVSNRQNRNMRKNAGTYPYATTRMEVMLEVTGYDGEEAEFERLKFRRFGKVPLEEYTVSQEEFLTLYPADVEDLAYTGRMYLSVYHINPACQEYCIKYYNISKTLVPPSGCKPAHCKNPKKWQLIEEKHNAVLQREDLSQIAYEHETDRWGAELLLVMHAFYYKFPEKMIYRKILVHVPDYFNEYESDEYNYVEYEYSDFPPANPAMLYPLFPDEIMTYIKNKNETIQYIERSRSKMPFVVLGCIVVVCVCIVILGGALYWRKEKKRMNQRIITVVMRRAITSEYPEYSGEYVESPMVPEVRIESRNPSGSTHDSDRVDDTEYLIPVDEWELDRKSLTVGHKLGGGEFGQVLMGNLALDGCRKPVAVKTLRSNALEHEMRSLLAEMYMLKFLNQGEGHPHIVSLLGCCTDNKGPVYIVMEYLSNHDLRSLLIDSEFCDYINTATTTEHHRRPLDLVQLVRFSSQIAEGCLYLEQKKVVHRDLAARNILVSAGYNIKIADFGLMRNINDESYYKIGGGRIPIRWLAPEIFTKQKHTVKSDVWSFGVCLWEVFSLGAVPYPDILSQDVIPKIVRGIKLERPPHATPDIYSLMKDCWATEPSQRPNFTSLLGRLEDILGQEEAILVEQSGQVNLHAPPVLQDEYHQDQELPACTKNQRLRLESETSNDDSTYYRDNSSAYSSGSLHMFNHGTDFESSPTLESPLEEVEPDWPLTLPDKMLASGGEVEPDWPLTLPDKMLASGGEVEPDWRPALPDKMLASGGEVEPDWPLTSPDKMLASGGEVEPDWRPALPDKMLASGGEVEPDWRPALPDKMLASGGEVEPDWRPALSNNQMEQIDGHLRRSRRPVSYCPMGTYEVTSTILSSTTRSHFRINGWPSLYCAPEDRHARQPSEYIPMDGMNVQDKS